MADKNRDERDGEDNSPFKVVDRRRFDSVGDARTDVAPRDSEFSSAPSAKPAAAPEPKAPVLKAEAAPAADPRSEQHGEDYGTVDFSSFIVSLATQAMVMLGEMPDPHSRQLSINLSAARQTIDILGMLEAKTAGNLIPEEARLISEVLASLRLAFVEKSRRSGATK